MRRLTFRRRRAGRGPLGAAVRLALVALALVLVWHAERALQEWQRRAAVELRFKTGLWFGWVIPAVLAGIVFGLAIWLPRGRTRYRWGRALALGLPPLLLLLQFYFVWGVALPHHLALPDLLARSTPFWDAGPQFALATFAGIAITSGFAEAETEP